MELEKDVDDESYDYTNCESFFFLFGTETKGLLIAAQNITIRTNHIKAGIYEDD